MSSLDTKHHLIGKLTTLVEVRDMSNVTEIPFLVYEEPGNHYWGVSDRDVPILIGAAVGESFSRSEFNTLMTRYNSFSIDIIADSMSTSQLAMFSSHVSDFTYPGAVGLVFLILGAVLIWYCTQFVFKRDKSIYSEYISSLMKVHKCFNRTRLWHYRF